MGAVRSSRPALLLRRNGSLRAHHRSAATARVDHQGRIHPRPATAGRGRLPLPAWPRGRRSARAPPARSITPDHPHLLARATTPQRPLAPPQRHPPQTRWDRRDRDRARARRLLLRDRHLDSPSRRHSAGIPAGGRPPHTASLQPRKQEQDHHSPQTHQLTLTHPTLPLRLARRPEHPRLARPMPPVATCGPDDAVAAFTRPATLLSDGHHAGRELLVDESDASCRITQLALLWSCLPRGVDVGGIHEHAVERSVGGRARPRLTCGR
jgi:hypothetical protein